MAKGKYEYWITPEGLLKLGGWARDGLTDEQVAKNMGISRSTLNEWRKKYPDISDTLKRGKEIADVEVENALFKKAIGGRYSEERYISVPMDEAEYSEKLHEYMNKYKYEHPDATDSELMLAQERFPKTKEQLVERKVKEVPGDTTAQIFWLKNRLPDKWRDKQEVQVSKSIDQSVLEMEEYFGRQKTEGS